MAEAVERAHVVSHEHDRSALVAHRVEDVEALLCEGGVANRKHLIDEQDLRVDLDRDGERQAHVHARRVVLELELLELAQFGEVDHRVIAGARLARREAHHDAVEHHVVARGQILVEADPELDEGRQAPVHPDPPAVHTVDAGQALQQRALAAAVAPRDAEELAPPHIEGNVVECLEGLVPALPQRVQSALLEGV